MRTELCWSILHVGRCSVCRSVWLRRLLLEIGFVVPHVCRVVPADDANEGEYKQLQSTGVRLTPPILCDNKGTVFTTNNPSIHINNKALETSASVKTQLVIWLVTHW